MSTGTTRHSLNLWDMPISCVYYRGKAFPSEYVTERHHYHNNDTLFKVSLSKLSPPPGVLLQAAAPHSRVNTSVETSLSVLRKKKSVQFQAERSQKKSYAQLSWWTNVDVLQSGCEQLKV